MLISYCQKKEWKTPRDSYVEMRQLVMPNHTNPQNTIFGGTIMSWIDLAAGMAATRHSERTVVTAHIDQISFKAPCKVGDHVLIKAVVEYVGKSSLEVMVEVVRENPLICESVITSTARLTMVAVDEQGKPTPVVPLKPSTPEEEKAYKEAEKLVQLRKKGA